MKELNRASLAVQLRARLAMQGHQFHPWSRKVPHAAGQLSPRATATKPTRYSN